MSNVLTGKIVITAPGAEAAFQSVATGIKKTDAAIIKLNPALSKFGETLETLKAKAAARKEFLNVEKDITKIGILNKELTVLEAEILRVSNIGKQGFDNLGNAISKVPPQLATVANGAGKTFSVLRQAAYILPGIGIAGLIGGLTDLVAGLFDTANAFSALDIAAGKFDNTIKGVKDDIESLKDSLEFEGKIQKLGLELSGLSGVNLSVGKTGIDIAQSTKLIPELDSKIKQLNESNKNLVSGFLKANEVLGQFGAGSQLVNLVRQFGAIEKIPSSFGDKLNKSDKELLRQYQATNTELKALQKQRKEAIQGIGIGGLDILNDINKGVSDKIKEISEKQRQVKVKIKPIIERPELGSIRIELPTILDPEKVDKSKISAAVEKLQNILNQSSTLVAKGFKLNLSTEALANQANLKSIRDQAQTLTEAFNNALKTSFATGFAAIGEGIGNLLSGQDFGNQIFQVFGTLFSEIGKALIEFGILRLGIEKIFKNPLIPAAIPIGLGIAAIAVGQLMKNIRGARADGGPVVGGQSYLVGERGPEIFTPNTGGGITANHHLGGRGNVRGSGMMGGQVVFKIAGKELIGVLSLAQASQQRLV